MAWNPETPLALNAPYPLEVGVSVEEPYVGPRSFQKDQRGFFFGRDEEAEELVSLITAHPVVLLYSQSGAGKTSLLNANLIPRLEETEHFNVLPPMRVQGQLPSNFKIPKKTNIFVLNALTSCRKTEWNGVKPSTSFAEYLNGIEKKTNQYGEPAPIVMVFDQFEELFTSYGGRWADRDDFFVQLGEAMEGNAKKGIKPNPLLRVVFCMREDFIAELDPYESLLPEKLRTRFRLEHLRSGEALAAITKPLDRTTRSYAPGVAEQLVKNLLKIPSQSLTGTQSIGLYVEPVQLQVVCQSIWDALTPDETVITKKHLEKYGDVSEALSKFYERSINNVASETGVKEETLRRWFADVLITPDGARAPINRGQEHTGGMPNNAVDKLEALRLIKGEWKGGTVRWYELAHDRFIEPIRKSNEKWLSDQSRAEQVRLRLEAKASKWKPGCPLLSADELLEAQRLVSTNVASPSLRTLVDASRASTQRKRIRLFKLVGVGSAMAALIFLVVAVYALTQRKAAREAATTARLAENKAKSRLLAFKAGLMLDDNPELSVLLAKAAQGFADSRDARDVIRKGLLSLSRVNGALRHDDGKVSSAEFSPDDRLILTRTADGKVRLWDAATETEIKRIGEGAEINRAQFSPDGKLIVTAEKSGSVRVWEADTGTFLRELRHHSAAVNAVSFSTDSKYIGTASDDNTACVWNVTTGELLKDLRGHSGKLLEVAFSPDGVHVATEGTDSTGRVWDLVRNTSIVLKGLTGPTPAIAFNHDGTLLATEGGAAEDGKYSVLVWDVITGKQKFKLGDHDEPIRGVAFSRDGSYIVTFSDDQARVWANNGALKNEFRHDKTEAQQDIFLTSASFSPDNKFLVTTSADKTVRVWDLGFGSEVGVLFGHSRAVNGAAFSSNGQTLISASDDQTVRVWPLQNEMRPKASGVALPHYGAVNSAAFSSKGAYLITTSNDEVSLRSLADDVIIPITFTVGRDRRPVTDAVFTPDGQYIVVASGKEAQFFNVQEVRDKGNQIAYKQSVTSQRARIPGLEPNFTAGPYSGDVNTVAFSPDTNLMVMATEDGKAVVWNVATRAPVGQVSHEKGVKSAVFSPDGASILTACADGYVRLWNAGTFAFVKNVGQHDAEVNTAQYSPDGKLIVTSSVNASYVWNVETGEPKAKLEHKGRVNSAAFSSDSSMIVTASDDKTTSVWDARKGENITVLKGHEDGIREAVFSPDGQSILTASEDETARLYSRETFAPFDELETLIGQRVARGQLTQQEIYGYLNETAEAAAERQTSDTRGFSVFIGILTLKYHGDWRQLCAELLSLLLSR